MLRFGSSGARLHDSVAAVCRCLCNSVTPSFWEDVCALVASHLITLDKCPGVQPIGIAVTLHRILRNAVYLAIRIDATVHGVWV